MNVRVSMMSLMRSLSLMGSLALFSGCSQPPLCEALGECGGSIPLGTWSAADSCSEDLYLPPSDKRLFRGDTVPARVPPPEEAFSDWCGGLVASSSNALSVTPLFYVESPAAGTTNLTYKEDGTYEVGLTRVGTYQLDLSATCMRQYGARDGVPAEPGGAPTSLCKQLEVPLAASGVGEGAYFNTVCDSLPSDPAGCRCTFNAILVATQGGTYQLLSNNEILHLPHSPSAPKKATFCNQGNRLQLTGADGAYLFDQMGLRTLDLAAVNCADGLQGFGETGIDCGGPCTPCP